jgi:hypothetical protein
MSLGLNFSYPNKKTNPGPDYRAETEPVIAAF